MSDHRRDVLVVVDAATLLTTHSNASRDPNAPTPIDGRHVYVLSTVDTFVTGRDGTGAFSEWKVGDELHLRESAHSLMAEESVLFYHCTQMGTQLLSPLESVTRAVTVPVPNPIDTENPSSQHMTDHFWRCKVLKSGSTPCAIDFLVLRRDGSPPVYFRWETRVDIAAERPASG